MARSTDTSSDALNSQIHITTEVLHHIFKGVVSATKAAAELASEIEEWIISDACDILLKGGSKDTGRLAPERWLDSAVQHFGEGHAAAQLLRLAIGVSILRERPEHPQSLPRDISLAWKLIYEALTAESPVCTASRSAQGFLSVALCSLIKNGNIEELYRLHVWLPDGKRGNPDFGIHSHQPFARSWILAGEATDHSYTALPAQDAASATHATYRLVWTDGKSTDAKYKTHQVSSSIVNTGELVSTVLAGSEVHTRDTTYTIASAAYHRTEVPPDAVHATLFVFDSRRGFQQDAPVLGPIKEELLTQLRDPAGQTPRVLAQLVETIRSWEILKNQGKEHSLDVEWEQCFQAFQKALHILDVFQDIQIPAEYRIMTLVELGNISRRFGRYKDAEENLTSALRGMEPSLQRAELSGELGVVYRHMDDLKKARTAFEDQYNTACQFQASRAMCRAIGNLGMVNYQAFQQNGDKAFLDSAVQQLLLRTQLARGIKASLQLERMSPEKQLQDWKDATRWETIGLARLSLCHAAKGDVNQAISSAKESLDITLPTKDATVIAMSRFFYGHALLLAGRTSEALVEFNPKSGCTPAMALCKEPSEEHRGYLKEILDAGADLDMIDEDGYTALDYAVFSNDEATVNVVLNGLRRVLNGDVEKEVQSRLEEAQVRRGYRELLQENLRPALRRRDVRMFQDLRLAYAAELDSDPKQRAKFDKLKFVHYRDFKTFGRLPRSGESRPGSNEKMIDEYSAEPDDHNAADYIIFMSYRWINKRENPNNLSPDDAHNTQYGRMLSAIAEFLDTHKEVDEKRLGIWMDYACVNQDDPISGVQALPMIILQCDAIISLVDETYYDRAWCSVEVMFAQTVRRAYGLHVWYEQVAVEDDGQVHGGTQRYTLREGDADRRIVMAEKKLSLEVDRPKVLFLERQTKLLA